MIFPQNEHGVGVLFEAGQERQRSAASVNGYGCGAGGVDGNGFDILCDGGACLLQTTFYRSFETFDIVFWMLSEPIGSRMAIQAVLPSGIMKNGRGDLISVAGIYDNGSNRICAVIDPNDKLIFFHMVIPVKITFIFLLLKNYFALRGEGAGERMDVGGFQPSTAWKGGAEGKRGVSVDRYV